MNLEKYGITSDSDRLTFEFLSSGPNGTIKKVVLYQEIESDVYNLAMGDWNEQNQRIDDNTRSNNEDRDKVLATVASTVIEFIRHHPNATVFAKGNTPAKTRLYQIGIAANFREITEVIKVQGFFTDTHSNGAWEIFTKNRNYEAFTARAR
jgi:hypothetical protein